MARENKKGGTMLNNGNKKHYLSKFKIFEKAKANGELTVGEETAISLLVDIRDLLIAQTIKKDHRRDNRKPGRQAYGKRKFNHHQRTTLNA